MERENFVEHLTYYGCFRNGERKTRNNVRVQIDLYTDFFFYIAEEDITGDEDYLVIQEAIFPYNTLKDATVIEMLHDYAGPFYSLRIKRFIDLRLEKEHVAFLELPESDRSSEQDKERAEMLLEVILRLRDRFLTQSGYEAEYALLQGKRRFFEEEYHITPEQALIESNVQYVMAKHREESLEWGLLDRYFHRRQGLYLHHLSIPYAVFNLETISQFDDMIDMRRVKYALGFNDLAEYKAFCEEDFLDDSVSSKDEPLENHDTEGIDPHRPLILLYMHSYWDSILLYPGAAPYAAWEELALLAEKRWTYEQYAASIGLEEKDIDTHRLGRHHFHE